MTESFLCHTHQDRAAAWFGAPWCCLLTLLLASWLLWDSSHLCWSISQSSQPDLRDWPVVGRQHALTEPMEVWKVGFNLSWTSISGQGHAVTSAQTAVASPFYLHMHRKLWSWLFPRALNFTGPGLNSDCATMHRVPGRQTGTWKLMSYGSKERLNGECAGSRAGQIWWLVKGFTLCHQMSLGDTPWESSSKFEVGQITKFLASLYNNSIILVSLADKVDG